MSQFKALSCQNIIYPSEPFGEMFTMFMLMFVVFFCLEGRLNSCSNIPRVDMKQEKTFLIGE